MKIINMIGGLLLLGYVVHAHADTTFTTVDGSPFTTVFGPQGVAFTPVVSGNLYAVTANGAGGSLSVFQVDQTTGVLSEVSGSPFALAPGAFASGIAISRLVSGKIYAAVNNLINSTVTMFSVDPATGYFTQIGSPVAVGGSPAAIAFSPITTNGKLYVATANTVGTISVYSVDQATGVLTSAPLSPQSVLGMMPNSIAFSPIVEGKLYAASATFGQLSVFEIDQVWGIFLPVVPGSPYTPGSSAASATFSPLVSGNLYTAVANVGDSTVSVYSVNKGTGQLTEVPGSPFAMPASGGANSVAFSPVAAGNLFAAVADQGNQTVTVFSVDPTTGYFSALGSPLAAGGNPQALAFSPYVNQNLFIAAANISPSSVAVFQAFIPSVQSPTVLAGCKSQNVFLLQTDYINRLSWNAPTSGLTPVSYSVFRDAALTQLIGTVSASGTLQFLDHNREPNVNYTYYVTAVDANNNLSDPASVTVTQPC